MVTAPWALLTRNTVEGVPRHVGKEAKPGELEPGQHLEEIEALGEAEAARVPWIRGSVAALIGEVMVRPSRAGAARAR
jgi:hypothetical protein